MSHLDAAVVAAIFIALWLLRRRSYRRALAEARTGRRIAVERLQAARSDLADTEQDLRAARRLLRQLAGTVDDALETVRALSGLDRAVDEAVAVANPDEPIPYLPVWTQGAQPEAGDEFDAIVADLRKEAN